MDVQHSFQHILDAHTLWIQLRYEHWIAYEAYTGIWWLLVASWVIPWIIWFFVVDRQRIVAISFYGLKVMFFATLLDAIGAMQSRWFYTVKIIPFSPHLESVDWSIIPVTYMLIYQYFPTWKGFIFAQVIFNALCAFVGEPFIAEILGLYVLLNWKHIYSFPLYIILGILPRITTEILYGIEKNTRSNKLRNR